MQETTQMQEIHLDLQQKPLARSIRGDIQPRSWGDRLVVTCGLIQHQELTRWSIACQLVRFLCPFLGKLLPCFLASYLSALLTRVHFDETDERSRSRIVGTFRLNNVSCFLITCGWGNESISFQFNPIHFIKRVDDHLQHGVSKSHTKSLLNPNSVRELPIGTMATSPAGQQLEAKLQYK